MCVNIQYVFVFKRNRDDYRDFGCMQALYASLVPRFILSSVHQMNHGMRCFTAFDVVVGVKDMTDSDWGIQSSQCSIHSHGDPMGSVGI